jgi:hypothetical protein
LRSAAPPSADYPASLLSIASAALAWLWNAGSFATLLLTPGTLRPTVETARFASLSLLPAVLLNLSLDTKFRKVAVTGYLLSTVATVMRLCEGLQPSFHLRWLITVGFGALNFINAAGVLRESNAASGSLG